MNGIAVAPLCRFFFLAVAPGERARDRSSMSRHALLVGLALLGFGCARSRAVAFQGHSSEPRVDVERVRETSVMPREASWLGRVIARCQPFTADGSFEDRALFDLDCSERRLRALLREGAADAGGNVLSEVVCNSGSTRECRALVSHLAGLAAQEATPRHDARAGHSET